jgi:hypothetical protein
MDDPDPAMGMLWQPLLLLLLILMNAFFAMSEIAIISLNDNKVRRMADDGHKRAKQVLKLTANASNFLSTIQIGVTLAGFLTSASAAKAFADTLASLLLKIPYADTLPAGFINGVSIFIDYGGVILLLAGTRRTRTQTHRHAVARKNRLSCYRYPAVFCAHRQTVCFSSVFFYQPCRAHFRA